MNEKSALKKAEDVYAYIEKESGYQNEDRTIKRIVTERFALTIRINGEVQQGFIDSMVRMFRVLKRNKEERAGISVKDLPAHAVEHLL